MLENNLEKEVISMPQVLIFNKDPKKNFEEAKKNIIGSFLIVVVLIGILWKIGFIELTQRLIYGCLGLLAFISLLYYVPSKRMLDEEGKEIIEKAYKTGKYLNIAINIFSAIFLYFYIGREAIFSILVILIGLIVLVAGYKQNRE